MNWFKSTMSFEQYSVLKDKFSQRMLTIPRPQKAFMYVLENGFKIQNKTGLFYEVYFTPDCNIYMLDFIKDYQFTSCDRPERESIIGLCTVIDFEDSVWK